MTHEHRHSVCVYQINICTLCTQDGQKKERFIAIKGKKWAKMCAEYRFWLYKPQKWGIFARFESLMRFELGIIFGWFFYAHSVMTQLIFLSSTGCDIHIIISDANETWYNLLKRKTRYLSLGKRNYKDLFCIKMWTTTNDGKKQQIHRENNNSTYVTFIIVFFFFVKFNCISFLFSRCCGIRVRDTCCFFVCVLVVDFENFQTFSRCTFHHYIVCSKGFWCTQLFDLTAFIVQFCCNLLFNCKLCVCVTHVLLVFHFAWRLSHSSLIWI